VRLNLDEELVDRQVRVLQVSEEDAGRARQARPRTGAVVVRQPER